MSFSGLTISSNVDTSNGSFTVDNDNKIVLNGRKEVDMVLVEINEDLLFLVLPGGCPAWKIDSGIRADADKIE